MRIEIPISAIRVSSGRQQKIGPSTLDAVACRHKEVDFHAGVEAGLLLVNGGVCTDLIDRYASFFLEDWYHCQG